MMSKILLIVLKTFLNKKNTDFLQKIGLAGTLCVVRSKLSFLQQADNTEKEAKEDYDRDKPHVQENYCYLYIPHLECYLHLAGT